MRDIEWFVPVTVVVAIQYLLWWWLAAQGLATTPLFALSDLLAYTFMASVTLVRYLWFLAQLRRAGETAPISRSIDLLKANWFRIIVTLLALQIISVQSALFSSLKAAIPTVNPFWFDASLVRLEGTLFGEQPWKLAYAALAPAVSFFDVAYETWLPIQIVAIFSVLLFKPSELKAQAMLSFVLAWLLLGIVAAGAFSSVGPIFFDRLANGSDFVGIPLDHAPHTAKVSAILWSSYRSGHLEIGSGISAMPSMHVALTLWLAFVLRRTLLAPLAWIYVAIIWIASVLLGWHYFTDGLAGIFGMTLIWLCTPSLLKFSSTWLPTSRGDARPPINPSLRSR